MKSPLEDTIWGAGYGSVAAVQAAFDRFGPEYHQAILASGAPAGAAQALMPHLHPDAQGIDFGCGSGVLGIALREAGLRQPLDGLDLSPVMLGLARETGCYRHLLRANLLAPRECPELANPYDFAITMGLMGDYVPYYVALPHIVSSLRSGAFLGSGGARPAMRWKSWRLSWVSSRSPKRSFRFPRESWRNRFTTFSSRV
jgi:SAM-dependent methyltransferase